MGVRKFARRLSKNIWGKVWGDEGIHSLRFLSFLLWKMYIFSSFSFFLVTVHTCVELVGWCSSETEREAVDEDGNGKWKWKKKLKMRRQRVLQTVYVFEQFATFRARASEVVVGAATEVESQSIFHNQSERDWHGMSLKVEIFIYFLPCSTLQF